MGSGGYLDAHGAPRSPEDLVRHECGVLDQPPHPDTWRLTNGTETRDVHVKGRFCTDSIEADRVAVSIGLGLGLVSTWLMHNEGHRQLGGWLVGVVRAR